ncbi:hypothetical protein O181_086043 [Austropuccinia psidii MF-1]|uniref:Retrotransposon gag domain-containing protein n=1 Tax=Austropuccinia psidii MF-1 TaxID=1389203 RepID=A0A9Q3FYM1_9BASI|nr:hypothetical protein [Austropuccinia psidii MF-1]
MTPTRSGSSFSIQSNGCGPGHSSHKSKRQEFQPRGQAQMEDARASTSSQRLASTFDTLIESPEADITAIPVVRPESLSAGNNRDIPVSVQELVYGSKTERGGTSPKSLDRHHELISSSEKAHGARKDRGTSEGLETHVLQRTGPIDKSLVEKPKHVIRGPEEEVSPREGKHPSGSSPSLQKQNCASTSAKQAQENPKDQPKGQAKGKGKGKAQVEQALPAELQDSQEREDSHGQCVQYGNNSDGIQKQGRGKIEPIFSKKADLVKLVNQIETCNKEITTKFKKSEYIQQKLGNEILQVKESQKTIIGLENVNKDNILSLEQICARIESKVTLLNAPDDNSISFITRQLKELIIQVQNLENSTGPNAALFQEQLEKSDKARLDLKEDIQSSINNISLRNYLPRQSTPIPDRNVLKFNNDLHHTISSNEEVETACNFKDIPRLEEWPTFSGEGEYNHMEFMKTIDMFKEDFNIPDEYISARLHSLFTKSAKKWYYKMRQDHGKHSWPWWKEQIISKWEIDSWRFKMENSFKEAIFNTERDRPMSCFLKQKDRLTALHPDMSETMVHKRILRKCGGDLEHAIRSRCIEPCSTEDYINAMEDITTRTKIGRNLYKSPIDNKASGNPISKPNKPQERLPLKGHKCGCTSHLANNCAKKTRINEIEIEKDDTMETKMNLV